MNNIKTLWKTLKAIDKKLQSATLMEEQILREKFSSLLKQLIVLDWHTLDKHQILQLCSWVSIYRPVEPFRFLMSAAKQFEKLKESIRS